MRASTSDDLRVYRSTAAPSARFPKVVRVTLVMGEEAAFITKRITRREARALYAGSGGRKMFNVEQQHPQRHIYPYRSSRSTKVCSSRSTNFSIGAFHVAVRQICLCQCDDVRCNDSRRELCRDHGSLGWDVGNLANGRVE